MTVFNVTRLNQPLANAVAEFFRVTPTKVELRYSDWFNSFGAYVKDKTKREKVSKFKRKVAAKTITQMLGSVPMKEILDCPVVNRSN